MRWIRDTKLYLIAGVVILTASLLGAHYINNQPRSGNGGTKPADSNINWTLYGPGTGGAAQCTTAIANAPTPSFKAVSGDNTYGPVSYVSAAVGTYEFAVTYGGDGPNTFAATAVGCDNRRERRAGDRYRLGNQLVEAGLAAERPDHP